MMPTIAEFRGLLPEFTESVTDDDTVQFWLDHSTLQLTPGAWGVCFNDAVIYLSAHQIGLIAQRASVGVVGGQVGVGAISSSSVDGVSASFATPDYLVNGTKEEIALARTVYGQDFLALREVCVSGGVLIGNGNGRDSQTAQP